MKSTKRLVKLLATAFILSCILPIHTLKAETISENTISENTITENPITENLITEKETTELEELSLTEPEVDPEGTPTSLPPDEAPAFHAHIEFRYGDYSVIGTFTDFTPDITLIQTLYSLDGDTWQEVVPSVCWNLFNLGTDDESKLNDLQNQPCLFANYEPLKSYIDGKIDRFYMKLRITREDGLSYETQSAVIERGGLQSIPEGTNRHAIFSSAISAFEPDPSAPYRRYRYARYQLTISADATAEEIYALLPDTLPVEVQLDGGPDFIAIGVVDCPVTWKPLSLPQLSSGESVIIPDAAEEILVPAGTQVSTPLGIFLLDEPLRLDAPPSTDEVRLVLNVSAEDKNPTGVLRAGKNGLEMAFHHKPTNAVSIQAYVLAEGETKWTLLSGLSILEELNQPSTANSGYALVLRNDQEPYQSYLTATEADETPKPFFICLKIEGGIYDGRQLILAWPDIYEQLPELPAIGGSGGNEDNAGADNKDDSTESGQRPNLPQEPKDNPTKQQSKPSQAKANANATKENHPDPSTDDSRQNQPLPAHTPNNASAIPESQRISPGEESVSDQPADISTPDQPDSIYSKSEIAESGQRPDLSSIAQDTAQPPLVVQAAADAMNERDTEDLTHGRTSNAKSAKAGSPLPFLLVTAAVMAIICIAVCKHLPGRITEKLREIRHRQP